MNREAELKQLIKDAKEGIASGILDAGDISAVEDLIAEYETELNSYKTPPSRKGRSIFYQKPTTKKRLSKIRGRSAGKTKTTDREWVDAMPNEPKGKSKFPSALTRQRFSKVAAKDKKRSAGKTKTTDRGWFDEPKEKKAKTPKAPKEKKAKTPKVKAVKANTTAIKKAVASGVKTIKKVAATGVKSLRKTTQKATTTLKKATKGTFKVTISKSSKRKA